MTSHQHAPRRRRRDRNRAVVVASALGLGLAALLVWLVVGYASENPDKVNLGSERFVVGSADRLANRIDEQRAPFLFKDPLSSSAGRELYVQHLGDDERQGWLAVEAYAPGAPREVRCILDWDIDRQRFVDPCGDAEFPPDGEGLVHYPTGVDDRGAVVVDLRDRR